MRPSQIFSALLFSSAATAWSFPDDTLGAALGGLLTPHKRAPQAVTLGSDDAPSPNPSQSINTDDNQSSSATDSSSPSSTGDSDSSQTTGTNSKSGTGTDTATGSESGSTGTKTASNTGKTSGTGTKTGTGTGKASATTFDPRLPAGGVSMVTPNPMSSASYYKIGNFITFAWNYTSLSVTPSAIDILATCSKNQATYTLALNQTIDGPTGAVTWDTNQYQATGTVPLLTEKYTLIIHDAAKDVTATPQAGYLASYMQFTFGMYSPQPYVPLDQYTCVTCSSALSSLERQSLATVGIMAGAAVLGGTWFVGGFSAIL